MSNCNFTRRISPAECLGDSLATINANFSSLDVALCETPLLEGFQGASVVYDQTEIQKGFATISTNNNIIFESKFDSLNGCSLQNIALIDGTTLETTSFPYLTAASKPLATFSTVSKIDKFPHVTLYYTANGVSNFTVFPLNSASSESNKGSIFFNGTVTSLLSSGNSLYVGGTFTEVGGIPCQKFAEINLEGGGYIPLFQKYSGSFVSNPFGTLGTVGEVKAIFRTSAIIDGFVKQVLIIGGSFQSIGVRGRGLIVYNITDGTLFPFYVNGEVNDINQSGNFVVVGGAFDYVNYGTSSLSINSGQRLFTNSLFKINLQLLLSGVTRGSLDDISSNFENNAVINSIAIYDNTRIHVGGVFKIRSGSQILNQNVAIVRQDGTHEDIFKALINGPVYKLYIDDTTTEGGSVYLYAGGEFSKHYYNSEYYATPRIEDFQKRDFYNALCYALTTNLLNLPFPLLQQNWKPRFNNAVTNFVSQDEDIVSDLYCYGKFTAVNEKAANYLCAVSKASAPFRGVLNERWFPRIPTSSPLNNSSLLKAPRSLIVGGTFDKIGEIFRYKLAEIGDTKDLSTVNGSLSSFAMDFGAKVLTPGTPLSFDFSTSYIRVSSTPLEFDKVNQISFPVFEQGFQGLTSGQLIRFFIRRPSNGFGNQETFRQNVNVLGWKVDFNH